MLSLSQQGYKGVRRCLKPPCHQRVHTQSLWGYAGNQTQIAQSTIQPTTSTPPRRTTSLVPAEITGCIWCIKSLTFTTTYTTNMNIKLHLIQQLTDAEPTPTTVTDLQSIQILGTTFCLYSFLLFKYILYYLSKKLIEMVWPDCKAETQFEI